MKIRRKFRTIIVWVLMVGLCIITACTRDSNVGADRSLASSADDIVRIGIYQPLSGKDQDHADKEIMGIELAHRLYPRVQGKKVELIYADNKSDFFHGKLAAQKLINKGVDIVLGSYGNVMSMVGGEYFLEAGIPAISITCTNPLVIKGNPCYFRIETTDSFQAIMAAKYVFNELKPQNVAILKEEEDDYGTALAQQFSDKLASLSEVEGEDPINIAVEEYRQDETSYEKQLSKFKEIDTQVIYLPCSWIKAAEIIKQAKKRGIDALFIGTDIWHDEGFIEEGGQDVEGVVFTDYFDGEVTIGQRTLEFLSAYEKEYGQGTPPNGTALGFDAYLLALYAIEKQEGFESLCDTLAGIKDFVGATGSITFDGDGDPYKPVVLTTIDKGEFKHKYTAEPQWN